jgi:O-antigen ligase
MDKRISYGESKGETILSKLIFSSLILLLIVTPIPYGTVEVWSTAIWEIWIFVTAILWIIKSVLDRQLGLAANPLVLPMLALLAIALIQLVPMGSGVARPTISFDSYSTLEAALKLSASILFLLLFATFVNTDSRRSTATNVSIGVCVLIALVGIGQSYIGKALWQRGSFGPFVHRNHFAGFLEMGIGLVGGLIVARSVRRELLAVYGSAGLVLCAGLVLSGSRGGMLALAAEIVFLALVAWPTAPGRKRTRAGALIRVAATILLGLGAIGGATLLVGSEGLVQNLTQVQTDVQSDESTKERFNRRAIWSATAQMIKDHPALGVGLGAFPMAYTRYDSSSGTQRVEQSHNDYLQILADTGVAGGVLVVIFAALLFGRAFSAARTRSRRRRAIILGAVTACFAIAVHSVVDFNLQVTANAQLFIALAALASTAAEESPTSEVREAHP